MTDPQIEYHLADFTEDGYREILRRATAGYSFERYGTEQQVSHLLWRHDVDFSPHRALRLAQIEEEEGVVATYFVLLHSEFYNWLESDVARIFREIADLGHDIGLHFDAAYYAPIASQEALEDALAFERTMLERLYGVNVAAFSFHNPEVGGVLRFDDAEMAGMINAYGRDIKEKYAYCSDSNGYWRFTRLGDFLDPAVHPRAQVLTHPEWWTPEPLMPRARVQRAIDGRAAATGAWYDGFLTQIGRHNGR